MKQSWICLALFGFILIGCNNGETNKPVSPKVDLSIKREPHEVNVEDLKFPEHFPKQIGLVGAYNIYEQDEDFGNITWDSRLAPSEVRDHYVTEFENLGYSTEVFEPKGMPGENYEIRAFDKENDLWHCVGVGKQRPESQVSCFIYSLNREEIEKEKARKMKAKKKETSEKDDALQK